MISKTLLLSLLIAYAEARFGQEQVPIDAISQVQGGEPGAAATIAGAAISDLLGGADPCAKLVTADQIVAELGGGADAIAAAIGMVTAEKNTNPFANGNVQGVCGDPALPATEELRGITPLIDPDVDVDGAVAALSAATAATPLDATGLSVFDLLVQEGLGDFVVNSVDGAAGGAGAGAADEDEEEAVVDEEEAAAGNEENAAEVEEEECEEDVQEVDDVNENVDDANENVDDVEENVDDVEENVDDAEEANEEAAAGENVGAGGADFGLCTPTIIFEGGLGGRPADEFTFQIADELARGGQGEALNGNIITTALCNQLTNVCEANDEAIAVCEDAAASVENLDRDKGFADAFNAAVGFAGAVTNPSGGPENPPEAAAARVRRSRVFRA